LYITVVHPSVVLISNNVCIAFPMWLKFPVSDGEDQTLVVHAVAE
jgi:hypothetical protein